MLKLSFKQQQENFNIHFKKISQWQDLSEIDSFLKIIFSIVVFQPRRFIKQVEC